MNGRSQTGRVDLMVCACCGRWSVELIYLDVARRRVPRLRVRLVGTLMGDFASPIAVATMLDGHGVLAELVDASTSGRGKIRPS